jgi:hypothetical protein
MVSPQADFSVGEMKLSIDAGNADIVPMLVQYKRWLIAMKR